MIVNKVYNENEKSYGPDLPSLNKNWKVKGFVLNADGDTYTVEVEWAGACPFEITQLQGKLQLSAMGLYDIVEGIVRQAGPPTKIYWQTAATWRRTSPIIADLAGQLGMSEEELDDFFIQAAKIR